MKNLDNRIKSYGKDNTLYQVTFTKQRIRPDLVIEKGEFFTYYIGIDEDEVTQLVTRDFGKVQLLKIKAIALGTKSSISGTGKNK